MDFDATLKFLSGKDIDEVIGIPKEGMWARVGSRQRGYVHGLCKKLNIDEDALPRNLKSMTVEEASIVIDELLIYRDYGVEPDWLALPF